MAIAWVLSLVGAYLLGYHIADIRKRIADLASIIKSKVDKEPIEEPKSEIIDPDDPVKEAMWEHEQMLKRLNPDD